MVRKAFCPQQKALLWDKQLNSFLMSNASDFNNRETPYNVGNPLRDQTTTFFRKLKQ